MASDLAAGSLDWSFAGLFPLGSRQSLLEELPEGTANVVGAPVAAEEVADLGSGQALRCVAERPEDLVGHRVTERVAEDALGRRLAVVPEREGGQEVLTADDRRAVEQRVYAGEPHGLCLGAGDHRAHQPRLALGELGVDAGPDLPSLVVAPDLSGLLTEADRLVEPLDQRAEVDRVGLPALG